MKREEDMRGDETEPEVPTESNIVIPFDAAVAADVLSDGAIDADEETQDVDSDEDA